MKTRKNKVTPALEPTPRFAPEAAASGMFRGAIELELDRLKERLLAAELQRTSHLEVNVLVRRAANDAVAMAWLTPFPLLVLPTLFAEKVLTARRMAGKQALIRERSSELLTLAE